MLMGIKEIRRSFRHPFLLVDCMKWEAGQRRGWLQIWLMMSHISEAISRRNRLCRAF